ncbi:MAG: energy transducer TonB [Verrucomicrobiales bacterium]|nr:energy transducer TonB [Verrucomicrobiales bacterium]
MIPVLTLVIWTGCATVGILGALLPYQHPPPRCADPQAIVATLLKIELTAQPFAAEDEAPAPTAADALPSPVPEPPPVTPAPPLLAVAEPNPKIAFELPVDAPVRTGPAAEATFQQQARPAAPAAADTGATAGSATGGVPGSHGLIVQTLAFGRGEARQPAPDYPRQAVRERQEGTVVVRLTVDEDGHVIVAEAASPSPWPLLNAAALRTVRERWRFRPGPVRLYEVPIRFELTNS